MYAILINEIIPNYLEEVLMVYIYGFIRSRPSSESDYKKLAILFKVCYEIDKN